MGLLDGAVAIVTGAGTGIGKESRGLLLAAEGAKVVLVGRRLAVLEDVATTIRGKGGTVITRAADIAKRSDVRELAASVKAELGSVDILVNNAGSASKVLNARWLSDDEWNSTLNVNLTAVFYLTQAVLPEMISRGHGTIITVSSLAALNPNLLGGAAYGAAKAGVRNFMQYLHNTFRNQGIRATTIMPGEANTPIMNNRARPPTESERQRMLDPHDVARAVLLCASLPERSMVPELSICPTFMRDTGPDIETARWQGAPADLPDLPPQGLRGFS